MAQFIDSLIFFKISKMLLSERDKTSKQNFTRINMVAYFSIILIKSSYTNALTYTLTHVQIQNSEILTISTELTNIIQKMHFSLME